MIRERRADLLRYYAHEPSWPRVATNTALWAVAAYRFGHWVYKEDPPRLVQPALKAAYLVVNKLLEATTEMFIDAQAEIGEGLYIGHSGGTHINNEAVIGRNCDIGHQVTIGTSAMGRKGSPQLGDQVYVGAGAKIIGKIRVGAGAKVAANSLVMTNVPAGATVMGVPARVVLRGAPDK
jgi:serine O-acetyltransferase